MLTAPKFVRHLASAIAALSLLSSATAQSSQPAAVTADLRYEEAREEIYQWSSFDEQKNPFTVEPKDLSTKVFRGKIKFKTPNGTLPVPYLWDSAKAKLYLDANRNGDLTDDASFPKVAPNAGRYQIFNGIHLAVRDGNDLYEQAFDATFWNYSNELEVDIASKSYWSGRVSLQGAEWQIGVLEGSEGPGPKGNGWLLLRPWSDHTKPFTRSDDALSCVFASSANLFIGQQAYKIECRYVPGTPSKYQIEFTPRQADLGTLQLTGKNIERLVLNQNTGERFCVVLDKPEGSVQVPLGVYQESRGALTGNIRVQQRYGSSSVHVAKSKPAIVNLGGPLTNTVSVTRRGPYLSFSYSLKGPDGREYEIPSRSRANAPRWIVYQGGKQIASGDFQYG